MKPISPLTNHTYLALLRGINVGGNKKVPMAELKKVFGKLGHKNVRTILASGNVVFEAVSEKTEKLSKTIITALEKKFSFSIPLIVIPFSAIEKIMKLDPFKKIKIRPEIRLYITFLSTKPKNKPALPYLASSGSFQIIDINELAVFSVLDLAKTQTTDLMSFLDKEFGKNITTRNWNTVKKIAQSFTPFPSLSTPRLTLRQLTETDDQAIFILRSDIRVNKYIDRPAHIVIGDAKAFIERINEDIKKAKCFYWAICQAKNELIGTICLFNFSDKNSIAELGYELNPAYHGKGLMDEAVKTILRFAFEKLKLKKVEAITHEQNNRSIKLLEKNGFKLSSNKSDQKIPDNLIYRYEIIH